MRKFADQYLSVEPWAIVEHGFHPAKSRVSESLFAQANEHMGARAFFEEGYGGDRLVGCYLNGVYEERLMDPSYKGISYRLCFMVNTIDWTYFRLKLDGEPLDLAAVKYRDFERRLDFRDGVLRRSFVWETRSGKQLEVSFERFLLMPRPELAYQRVRLTPRNFSGSIEVETGLDFSVPHEFYGGVNHWNVTPAEARPNGGRLRGTSVGTRMIVDAGFRLTGAPGDADLPKRSKVAARTFALDLKQGQCSELEKVVAVAVGRSRDAVVSETDLSDAAGFEAALADNRAYWDRVWDVADVKIEGDPENQQGIRFCIFQLEQTFHGQVPGANIGAKGLTGEAYNGNAFWDTEAYCFPYYLFHNQAAARALLDFRYATLPQAKERASTLDCEGACFPVATTDGTESCNLWQHASLQFQPTTAVAYALAHYVKVTGDRAYLYEKGAELMVEIARFLASRVGYSERKQAYGFYAVMGPDEFQMMVNHNAYTNFMGAKALRYAVEVWTELEAKDAPRAKLLTAQLGLDRAELDRWQTIAEKMYIPRGNGVFEQHEGFFDLPHVDIKSIPAEEFPLYHSWSYDRIYRNDMIKQPDVLMFMFLYNQEFSLEEKRANYEYYEPRTIHESSLSPSVHSIFAVELGRTEEAYDFFKFATRIDLDDYNRNAREGLHLTAISAAWMNIVYGFGGLRSDGDHLVLNPLLPEAWQSLSFKLSYQGSVVRVEMLPGETKLTLERGPGMALEVSGQQVELSGSNGGVVVAQQTRPRPAGA